MVGRMVILITSLSEITIKGNYRKLEKENYRNSQYVLVGVFVVKTTAKK